MGIFSQSKTYTVALPHQNVSFDVAPRQTILAAALEAGVNFPRRCQVGSCGSCKCKLLDGKVKPQIDFEYVLSGDQIKAGYILACQSTLKSDIKIDVKLRERKNNDE